MSLLRFFDAMMQLLRTTLRIDYDLFRELEDRASSEGLTLSERVHLRFWSELLRGVGIGGDLSIAAWIAALAHGASVLTLDSDFARFPGLHGST